MPIRGMFYRWSCDMAGPFPESARGNVYILVMIEHFSKWIEIAAVPSKETDVVAEAFKEHVLCRYGAPAEVLTE